MTMKSNQTKLQTEKQRLARRRNWTIFQLRGAKSALCWFGPYMTMHEREAFVELLNKIENKVRQEY